MNQYSLPAKTEPWRRRRAEHRKRYSSGQSLVVFSFAVATLIGAMALGADVAVFYYNWVQLQKAADASALAGASYLPSDVVTAESTAEQYARTNGVIGSDIYSAQPINNDTEMEVTVQRTVPYYFARVLGLTSAPVSVTAIAEGSGPTGTVNCGPDCQVAGATGSATTAGSGATGSGPPPAGGCGTSTGQYNVLPIGVDSQTAGYWQQGQSYTLNRIDSNGNGPWVDAPGNWGFVSLCGNGGGGAELRSAIAGGYYGELSIGNTLQTVPGVKNGPVRQGLEGLLDRAPGTVSVPTPSSFNPSDPRAVIIPMVDFAGCNGRCDVPITGFLAYYINLVNTGTNSNGISGAINGTFIAMVDPNSTPSINAPYAGAQGDVVLIK